MQYNRSCRRRAYVMLWKKKDGQSRVAGGWSEDVTQFSPEGQIKVTWKLMKKNIPKLFIFICKKILEVRLYDVFEEMAYRIFGGY